MFWRTPPETERSEDIAASWTRFITSERHFPFDCVGDDFRGEICGHTYGPALCVDACGTNLNLRCRKPAPRRASDLMMIQALEAGDACLVGADGTRDPFGADAVLLRPWGDGAMLAGTQRTRVVSLILPRHLITPRFIAPNALAASFGLREHCAGAKLLRAFLFTLAEQHREFARGPNLILEVTGSLLAALAAAASAGAPAQRPETKSLRYEAIQMFLSQNFADPTLSASSTARQLGISTRYIHKIMKQGNRSFQKELTALRLRSCQQALLDPQQNHRSISEMAFASGFRDLSQFNRHFRATFGITPNAMRAQAREATTTETET